MAVTFFTPAADGSMSMAVPAGGATTSKALPTGGTTLLIVNSGVSPAQFSLSAAATPITATSGITLMPGASIYVGAGSNGFINAISLGGMNTILNVTAGA